MVTFSGDASVRLPEFDDPPDDPVGLLQAWLAAAVERGVREPYAMVLATADATGVPSSRVVTLKAVEAGGLVFTGCTGGCATTGSVPAGRGPASNRERGPEKTTHRDGEHWVSCASC